MAGSAALNQAAAWADRASTSSPAWLTDSLHLLAWLETTALVTGYRTELA
jgi:hypothetical protein